MNDHDTEKRTLIGQSLSNAGLGQKALEILRALADMAAAGNSLTISKDWDFGSATLIDQDGMHTHIGDGFQEDEQRNFEAFVDGLHGMLVDKCGLSWSESPNVSS